MCLCDKEKKVKGDLYAVAIFKRTEHLGHGNTIYVSHVLKEVCIRTMYLKRVPKYDFIEWQKLLTIVSCDQQLLIK